MPKAKRGDLFDALVLSAIDFARRSVRELQSSPKYSMIHFSTALELFLKARLLREHWSLVVSRTDTASAATFRSGQFHSVSMDEAIKRLRNIAGESIPHQAEKAFRTVREHRNRLVHFLHPDFADKQSARKVQVAADQYRAWHFLSELVAVTWQPHFRKHAGRLARLDRSMHRLRDFLKVKYDTLRPEIKAKK